MRPTIARMRPHTLIAAGVVAAAAVSVAGCSAGQITQTDSQVAAVTGEQFVAGSLRISDAALESPGQKTGHWAKDSDVQLKMSIANISGKGDVLESASTDAAKQVTIKGNKDIRPQGALTVDGKGKDVGTAAIELEGTTKAIFPGQVIALKLQFRDAGAVDLRLPVAPPPHDRTNEPKPEGGGGH